MEAGGDLRWLATIAAALIGAFVAMIWSPWRQREDERRRRREKVRDLQIALRAEISNYEGQLSEGDLQEHLRAMRERMLRDERMTPFVPRESHDGMFSALQPDIHLLPRDVVAPVVCHYSQLQGVMRLAEDMRSADFAALNAMRRVHVYEDYIAMQIRARRFAFEAIMALNTGVRASDRQERRGRRWTALARATPRQSFWEARFRASDRYHLPAHRAQGGLNNPDAGQTGPEAGQNRHYASP